MKIEERHKTVRCHGCLQRAPRTGGKQIRRVRLKGGMFMPINEFYCAGCVSEGRHLIKPKKGEGDA